jgi:hypothetical protein
LFGETAGQGFGEAAGVLDILEAACHLTSGIGFGLAVLR